MFEFNSQARKQGFADERSNIDLPFPTSLQLVPLKHLSVPWQALKADFI